MIYIALGSNIDAITNLKKAVELLSAHPSIRLVATSPWYRTRAIAPTAQPYYVNAVVAVESSLAPEFLMESCHAIEATCLRRRSFPNAARSLDMDVLLYHNAQHRSQHCQIPHPRMQSRRFVLQPLSDLDPTLYLPDGNSLQALLSAVQNQDVEILSRHPISDYGLDACFEPKTLIQPSTTRHLVSDERCEA